MPPFAPARAWFLAFNAVAACNDPPPPDPTKLSEQPSAFVPEKPPRSEAPSPFRNPEIEPPPPRSEPQLPPAELAAALTAAEEALRIGDHDTAISHLRTCANRVPQSARCEGELAMLLVKKKRYTAEARYYIEQMVAADDPALDDAYYRRFGAAMMAQGRSAEASIAYERMLARSTPTAADWHLLSTALQGVPERLADAAEASRKAYELDPTHPEWLREEAILLSQMPDKIAQSLARFEAYKATVKDPALLADTDRRMAELRMIDPSTTNKPAPKQRKQKPASG
jgi:tetratricopeptide (TPR) repeat protein